MITLETITEKNFDEVLKLSVRPDQARFIAANVHSLAQCYLYREANDVFPYAIVNEERVVGFALLYSDDEEAEPTMTVWRIMIDAAYQGQGYGREAMKRIIDLVHSYQKYQSIFITHHPENLGAQKLYESLQFTNLGLNENQEILMRLDLKTKVE